MLLLLAIDRLMTGRVMRHRSAPTIEELLGEVVAELGLDLSTAQLQQLAIHFELLLQWNQRVNLTSIRRPEEIAVRHFEESLFLAKLFRPEPGLLVDVGSGAGFPGLPLKVAWPFLEAVLLEPNKKKAAFLKEVVRGCHLEGVAVRTERLEAAVRGDLAGRATLVTVRAVRSPELLLPDLEKLLAERGKLALFIGAADVEALAALPGFQWEKPQLTPHSERRVILVGLRL